MKLEKALRGYYREQVDAVTIACGRWEAKTKSSRVESRVLNAAFHTILMGLIVTAMISGYYQPSRLNQKMVIIIDRYNIEERMTDSLENLIIIIKNNRSAGGRL